MEAAGLLTVIILVVLAIAFLAILFSFVPVMLWISAMASGVYVGLTTLIGMRLRRIPPARIINPLIKARKAGLDVTIEQLETHYLAGGNVDRVVDALIAAQRANIDWSFSRAAAIDLAGRDVLEAVQMSVNPKVIETPMVSAVAKDGIEVKVRARVTVRANIDRLVGGAGEETIIARVGEGIVTTNGSADSHKEVLENPDMISQTVLDKGLDAGTAFEILSIDIADVDVGEKHRGRAADRPSRGRQADRPGQGGGAAGDGRGQGAGDARPRGRDARQGGGGGGPGAHGPRRGPAFGQDRRDGLLSVAELDGRHQYAEIDRRSGQRRGCRQMMLRPDAVRRGGDGNGIAHSHGGTCALGPAKGAFFLE